MDKFQERYLAHQLRKKKILETKEDVLPTEYGSHDFASVARVISSRRSRRIFKDKIDSNTIEIIKQFANLAPTSCARHGIYVVEADSELKSKLVGGKNWCENQTVLAFFADMTAYKSPYEQGFMPYLDTGFMAENIYLICEVLGLGCCFINPNTHNEYESEDLLCGAIAIGKI